MITAGVTYLGLVALTLVQALRAQPLLRPDAWTWMSLAALAVLAAIASAGILAAAHLARFPRARAEALLAGHPADAS